MQRCMYRMPSRRFIVKERSIDKSKPYLFVFGEWHNLPAGERWLVATLSADGVRITTDQQTYRVIKGRLRTSP